MARTAKPVALGELKYNAQIAAKLLFLLRDGRPGALIEQGAWHWELRDIRAVWPKRAREAIAKELGEWLRKGGSGKRTVLQPVFPAPELWKELKDARSEREIREVADAIGEWDREQGLGYTPRPHFSQRAEYDFVEVLRSQARTILKAKRLPEYPKSDRETSDDKRIWFFAKSLAGLKLDRSPLYALKRLSHWRGGATWRLHDPRHGELENLMVEMNASNRNP